MSQGNQQNNQMQQQQAMMQLHQNVKKVVEMFPQVSREQAERELRNNGGELDLTCVILSSQMENQGQNQPQNPQKIPNQQPQDGRITNQEDEMQRAIEASMAQPTGSGQDDVIMSTDDADMNAAIMASMKTPQSQQSYEPLSIEQRIRPVDLPVGLRNIGNTCYFNSLLQMYYNLPQFVTKVLTIPDEVLNQNFVGKDDLTTKKIKSGVLLIKCLQRVFGLMTSGINKYADPGPVLRAIIDDNGNQVQIGEQSDISEFNQAFIGRISDVYKAIKQSQVQQQQDQINQKQSNAPAIDPNSEGPALQHSASSFKLDDNQEMKDETEKEGLSNGDESEDDEITASFCGRITNVLSYSQNNEIKENRTKEKMQSVLLNVQDEKDIYAAWEQAYHDSEVDYRIEEGPENAASQVKADKVSYLVSLPEVMILQMNRVKFENNLATKTNHAVPILPEIFPDRFMMQNKSEIEHLKAQVNKSREQTNYLEKCLTDYRQFGTQGSNINGALDMVCDLLGQQGKKDLHAPCPQGITSHSPFTNKTAVPDAVQKFISEYRSKISQEIQEMEQQIKNLLLEVQNSYQHLEKNKYSMHAVCIHQGSAESGHYYSFIKDHQQNKWRKYNDIRVTEVEEKEVFEEANGGSSNSTAFWVVYINQDILEQSRLHNITNQQDNSLYKNALPQDIVKFVQQENAILNKQYQDFKDEEIISMIDTKYTERIRQLDQMYKLQGQQKKPQWMDHSSIYAFWWSKQGKDAINNSKRIILQEVIKMICLEKDVQNEQITRIMGKIQKSQANNQVYPRPHMDTKPEERRKLQEVPDWISTYFCLHMINRIFQQLVSKGPINDLVFLFQTVQAQFPKYVDQQSIRGIQPLNLVRDTSKITGLQLCTEIRRMTIQLHKERDPTIAKKIVEAAYCVWAIAAIVPSPDHHFQVYKNSINMTKIAGEKVLTEFGIAEDLFKIISLIGQTDDPKLEINSVSGFNFTPTEETQKLTDRLKQMNLQTMFDLGPMLKDDERIDQQFQKQFTDFKRDLGPWMDWHLKVAKTQPGNELFDMGKEFEMNMGIDLDDLKK